MSEKLIEEYDIDFNNPEATLKSLKITALLVLDKQKNIVFSFPKNVDETRLFKLANAVLSLLDRFSPWTAIESNSKKIYFFEKNDNVVILETSLSEEEFQELMKIIDNMLDEFMEEG